jgi:HAD superfamily hydrolase (TIGR01490 family)
MNKTKIAFFDVCETLISFQTADAFVDYIRDNTDDDVVKGRMQRREWWLRFFHKIQVVRVCNKFLPGLKLEKRMKLWQLEGLKEVYLLTMGQHFVEDVLRYHEIKLVVNEMQQLILDGYDVILVSAGYDVYLQFLGGLYGVPVIATELDFDNGICTGRWVGKDCYGQEKVRRICRYLGVSCEQLDGLQNSVAYSDSESDLPMLNLCKKGVAIIHNQRYDWSLGYKLRSLYIKS